jgi:hypothetical protein
VFHWIPQGTAIYDEALHENTEDFTMGNDPYDDRVTHGSAPTDMSAGVLLGVAFGVILMIGGVIWGMTDRRSTTTATNLPTQTEPNTTGQGGAR